MHKSDDVYGMIHFGSSTQGSPTASYSSPLPHEHHSPTWLRASNPTGSSTGRASMSVRSMTTGRPLPMVATIPVVARPDLKVGWGRMGGLRFRMSVRSMTTGRTLLMVATIPVVARPDLNVVRGRMWGLKFRMSDCRCAA